MSVGSLEEIIDDNHAIVSTSVGSEHYVSILSFVDKDLLEPGCSVLLNHKVRFGVFVFWIDSLFYYNMSNLPISSISCADLQINISLSLCLI